jgi:6-phosphogluconolactonase
MLSALTSTVAVTALALAPIRVYIGTYTDGTGSKGIYLLELDPEKGTLSAPEPVVSASNPSFLALHREKPLLLAVAETMKTGEAPGGAVISYAIDAAGRLAPLSTAPSQGAGPCHLSVDPSGKGVLVANYGSGTLGMLRLADDGTLTPLGVTFQGEGKSANPDRQEGPHAHCVRFDPSGRHAYEADLGLDKVHVFDFDPERQRDPLRLVMEIPVEPGSGPRHVAFSPDGRTLYILNEIALTITVVRPVFAGNRHETLQTISTLPEGASRRGASTAEIVMHPSGKYLYSSNRGHDSIASFRVDPVTGKLEALGHTPTGGKTPRNFNIDPTGKWLIAANQNSGTLTVFAINPDTGGLTPHGEPVRVPAPVCVLFAQAR